LFLNLCFLSLFPLIFTSTFSIIYQRLVNGIWSSQSFLGHNLFGKVAFVINNEVKSSYPDVLSRYYEKMKGYRFIQNIENKHVRSLLRSFTYDFMRYGFFEELTQNKLNDNELKAFSIEVITSNPAVYMRDIYLNYFQIWEIDDA